MNRTVKIISSVATLLLILTITGVAFAQGAANTAEEVKNQGLASNFGLISLGAGLGIGQGRAAGSALDGIARNPGAAGQIRGPMILGLALIESLVIYALIIGLLLTLKVGA